MRKILAFFILKENHIQGECIFEELNNYTRRKLKRKKEIKKLTEKEMINNLEKLKKDLFNFRFQKVNGQVKNPAKISETKKNIACLKTMIEVKNA